MSADASSASAEPPPAPNACESGPDGHVASYDIVRVVAIAAVIALHVTSTAHTRAPALVWPWILDRGLIDYAAPMLLIVAGALSWSPERLCRGEYGAYMAACARRVLVPYCIWAAFYMLYRAALGAPEQSVFGYLELLVTGLGWYHLWFVPAVMVVYIVAPVGAVLARRHPLLPLVAAYAISFIVIRLVDVPDPVLVSHRVQRSVMTTMRYLPYAGWGRSMRGPGHCASGFGHGGPSRSCSGSAAASPCRPRWATPS